MFSTDFSNWWLVSHLTDLLSHHGILKPHVHKWVLVLGTFHSYCHLLRLFYILSVILCNQNLEITSLTGQFKSKLKHSFLTSIML